MKNSKTLILAHRGASAYAPENTLEAMKLALDMGADGVELDVHLSKDGRIMVCHDEKIDRTSNGQGLISSYTYDELRLFDFGFKYYNEIRGLKIPTLDEVYELLAPHGLIVNVEIKSANPAIISALYDLEQKYSMQGKIIYSSFDHLQLERMKKQYPSTTTAPLYAFNMIAPEKYAKNMNASAIHPNFAQLTTFPDYVKNCHDLEIRVNPWTANKEEDMQMCFDAGCDAIITNYPDVAINLRDKK